ncbi:MAG TPA: hypothetical protein VKA84_29245 [Gemmatimonadaceae bacterium]|nr:hypothetical protein [Gemmatimonadaceae bacterium]
MTALAVGALLALAAAAYVALPLLRGAGRLPDEGARDAAEELVLRYRLSAAPPACPRCGPRPEADAVYCSTCGRKLGS